MSKKPAYSQLQHFLETVAGPIAMVLRALDVGNLGIVKIRHDPLQPVGSHHIVAVDDADHLGVGCGLAQHVVQRAGLEALHDVEMEELEALSELGAVILHRPPHRWILGVVVDDDDFEVGIVHGGQRFDGLDDHCRRLVADRDVDRDLGPAPVGRLARDHLGGRQGLAGPSTAPDRFDQLKRLRQRHREAQHQEEGEHAPADHLAGHHVSPGGHGGTVGDGTGRQRDETAERQLPGGTQARPVPQKDHHQRHRGCQRPGGIDPPLREGLDRTVPRELRLAIGVPQPPIAAGLALEVIGLPRLVDRLDHEVLDVLRLQPGDHVADVLGLLGRRGALDEPGRRAAPLRAVRWPADLGDDDVLVRIGLAELADLVLEIVERRFARLLVPVGQDVHGEIIDFLGQFRVIQPDVPRLGGADRHLDVTLDVPDLANELSRAGGMRIAQILLAVPAQDVLVADQHALDARVLVGHANQRARLLGVDLARLAAELQLGLVRAVDPRAGDQLQSEPGGDLRHVFTAVGGAISADRADLAGQHREVALDLLRDAA